MEIGHLINLGKVSVNNVVSAPVKKAVTSVPIAAAGLASGAAALANINKAFISSRKEDSVELYESRKLIKCLYPNVSDETFAWFVTKFVDRKSDKPLSSQIWNDSSVFSLFNRKTPEEQNQCINSEFVNTMVELPCLPKLSKFFFSAGTNSALLDLFDGSLRMPLMKNYIQKFCEEKDLKDDYFLLGNNLINLAEYCKIDKNGCFDDILMQRNIFDVSELIKILSKYIPKCDDKQQQELKKLLSELLEIKTVEGKLLFRSVKVGEVENTSMDGIENFIDAKLNDPDKFNLLMNLAELTKTGKIPSYVLGNSAGNATVSPDFIAQTNKLKNGVSGSIPFSDKKSALENSKVGDTVKIEDEIFYRNKNGLQKIDLAPDVFEELFPGIESIAFSQGNLPDCYLVSAIFDFMKNDKGREIVYKMFKSEGNDVVVTIPDAKDFPIRFPNGALPDNENRLMLAAKGAQMLEYAFLKSRLLKFGISDDIAAYPGCWLSTVYASFLGTENVKNFILPEKIPITVDVEKEWLPVIFERTELIRILKESDKEEDKILFKEHAAALMRELMMLESHAVSTVVKENELFEKAVEFFDPEKFLISTGTRIGEKDFSEDKWICTKHAYNIHRVDKDAKTIDVINPYNTSQYVTLTAEEFNKYFNSLYVGRLPD